MDQSSKDQSQSDHFTDCTVTLGTFVNADSSEERAFMDIIALSADIYWQQNRKGICTAVCSYTNDMRTAAEWLLSRKFSSVCNPAEHPEAGQTYISLTSQHKAFRKLDCVLETDNQRYRLEISGIPQHDAHGKFSGYWCTAIDKTSEYARRSSLLRFRAAVDMSMDMIYLVDRETLSFLDVNDTACRNAGMSREQLLKTGPARILGLSEFELATRYDRLIREGGSSRIERLVSLQDDNSAMIEVHSRATCIDGRWIIIGVSRDISDRKRAELRALHLQQMFSALSLTNEAILRADSVASLYQSTCNAAVSCALFTVATILERSKDGQLHVLANAGNMAPELKRTKKP
jgi:PAS domain S-box-containing protein